MKFYIHIDDSPHHYTCACDVTDETVTMATLEQVLETRLKPLITGLSSTRKLQFCKKNKSVYSYKPSDCPSHVFSVDLDVFAKIIEKKADVTEKLKPPAVVTKPVEIMKKQAVELKLPHIDTSDTVPKTVGDWLKLGKRWLRLGHANKCVEIYTALLAAKCPTLDAYNTIIEIYLAAERPRAALRFVRKARRDFPEEVLLLLTEGECLLAMKDGERALDVFMDTSKQIRGTRHATVEVKHQIQTGMCRAHQLKGDEDMALVLIQGVVRENRQNLAAMLEYAKLTYRLGPVQASEAAVILLTCLVDKKDDRYRQRLIADFAREPCAIEHLRNAMVDAKTDPAALAFLANVVRDHGAIKESLELLELALTLDPGHVNIFLNYMHTLEIVKRHDMLREKRLAFLHRFPPLCVDVKVQVRLVQVEKLAIEERHDLLLEKTLVFLNHLPALCVGGVTNAHLRALLRHLQGQKLDLCAASPTAPEDEESPLEQVITSYSDFNLCLLAVWFTVVKVLYARGALASLPRLVYLLDPLYKDKELHKTFIKNEAAYYGCISQVVSTWPADPDDSELRVAPSVSAENKFIYLLGDSHCLAPAWRTIHCQDDDLTIHPALSTGTKIWHLRPDSVFYPKLNFEAACGAVPDGACVIVLLGEIDCREALLQCVESCKYQSVEEGITALLDIYASVLHQLRQRHRWRILVHPVPPVLTVTRPVVQLFNSMLQSRLAREEGLHYLDLLPALCTNDGALRPEFEFDGTHLHPSYAAIFEKRI